MAERHVLSKIEEGTAWCSVCGPVRVWKRPASAGSGLACWTLRERKRTRDREAGTRTFSRETLGDAYLTTRKWRVVVADRLALLVCERCGFLAEDVCQLDVDHIIRKTDGGTNDPNNLQVLCANCHRLKTKREVTP